MTAQTKAPSTPNTRTYNVSDKKLLVAALGYDCPIPYCTGVVDTPCTSAKGTEVQPHTKRVQKAIRRQAQDAHKAAQAKKDPKAASKAAAKPASKKAERMTLSADGQVTVDGEVTTDLSRQQPAEETSPVEARLYEVCKPCSTRHHKKCRGTSAEPCGCASKVHETN